MMKRCFQGVVIFFLMAALLSGKMVSAAGSHVAESIFVPGARGNIPSVLTIPSGTGPFPVVILCHGHGGSKDEAGGFVALSENLAATGIASIRMDFPGCGDSKEDFTEQNNIGNMLGDITSTKEYLKSDSRIDISRLGIVGYSMGGRLAMLTTGGDDSYCAVVLWAPAGNTGAVNMFTFMQCNDQSDFDALYDAAKRDGKVTYTAIFGFDQTLGRQWFDDMLDFDPVTAFAGFKGDLLTIYGDLDIIILPDNAKTAASAAVNANSSKLYEVKGADHGFGFYSNEQELTQELIDQTVKFLKDKLN